jgi:murein DD-endopeptidase MepM/ murein hydrolase activator NlpD
MRRVVAATSVVERIEAQRRLAAAERAFLVTRIADVRARHEELVLRVAETRASADGRRAVLERLLQQTYRVTRTSALEVLLRRGSVVDVVVHIDGLAALSDREREILDELRALEADLALRRDELARQEAELATLAETVAAKDAALATLEQRAERLVAAARIGPKAVSDEEIRLIRSLAEEAARESEAAGKLIAEIARQAGAALPAAERWVWPVAGLVTQEFGPSDLALEPPRTYKGVTYPRFHDGIDVAAPLGAPVRAAARGRVAFVGHLAGGAMVVVAVHDGGLVTLYGHLDDTVSPPPVRVGDMVEPGERVGAVGLTGVATGPHLHFVVSREDEPFDPRVVLPPR